MKRTCILFLTLSALNGWAQTTEQNEQNMARERERAVNLVDRLNGQFQVYVQSGQPGVILSGSRVVTGHPFSATEENRSLQVLGNGARIESSTTGKLFRDVDGRTRTENSEGTITIVDPVAGFRATLNPKTKTANRINQSAGLGGPFGTAANQVTLRTTRITTTGSELRENLGVQSVNGVSARGERVTVTIPKGDIGNDRDLKVVTERWTSEDLQMLIKSTNSDPRYGDTVYELTGVSLSAPDPALFQIPADYNTVTGGGRGSAAPVVIGVPGARGGGRSGKQ